MHLGRVGVGVVVRDGAPLPDIASIQALKGSLIEAEAVVYNTASSGTYIDGMLKKLGVFDQIQGKLIRLWDGTAVMHHLMEGKIKEFGFGGITDILLYRDRGLRLVGPLPAEIQNYANYSAAVIATAPNAEGAKAFMAYLASPDGRALFLANGIPQYARARGPDGRQPDRSRQRHFIRSLIFSSAALAHTTSFSPPGAPLTPIAPITSSPALIATPPALSSRWGTLANALDTGPVFERSTSSAVSVPKLAAV